MTMRAGRSFAFGDDEKAVEHARMRLGLRRGEHDDDLVDVRGDDALALPATRRAARQLRAARKNLGDRPAPPRSTGSSTTSSPTASLSVSRGRGHGVAAERAVGALAAIRLL